MYRFSLAVLTTLILTSATAYAAPATIGVYISAPKVNIAPSTFSGLTTETFTSLSTGNRTTAYSFTYNGGASTATYSSSASSPFAVVGDDQYGNGTGNYFSIGAQSGTSTPVTLSFSTPVAYFGLAYQAGDSTNGLTFVDSSNSVIGRFSTARLLTLLNNGTGSVKAVNGNTYNTSQYFGKPTNGQNSGEAYAFLNFFASGGTISKVIFDNSSSSGSGFETDNHTVSVASQTPAGGDFVFLSSVSAPEAAPLALLAFAGLPALGIFRVARHRS